MMNPMKQLAIAFSLLPKPRVGAFTAPVVTVTAKVTTVLDQKQKPFSPRFISHLHHSALHRSLVTAISTKYEEDPSSKPSTSPYIQAHRALLISSFHDGLLKSKQAQNFLRSSLLSCMLRQQVFKAEKSLTQSASQSPCNGPDPVMLDALEQADMHLLALQNNNDNNYSLLSEKCDGVLRFVYIPTALYALRTDSDNSPGKQRQRARADAKGRRNDIVQTLQSLFSPMEQSLLQQSSNSMQDPQNPIRIHSVTLDLDDGSIKHPEGSKHSTDFPKTGKQALQEWQPHFIYVEGGNTFWLYHCMEKGDWRADLVNLVAMKPPHPPPMVKTRGTEVENKENIMPSAVIPPFSNAQAISEQATIPTTVYCGKSAGAILAGARVETATWKEWDDPSVVPGRETYMDWRNVCGLDLLGGSSIFPHMSEEWESLVASKIVQTKNGEAFPSHVYTLRDSQICLVDGEEQSITVIQNDESTTHEEGNVESV